MSKEQLMSQEERSFQEYLAKIHGAYTSEKLSYFEHNLEVRMEWGQEWGIVTVGHIGLGSGRRGILGLGTLPPILFFQTWRQLWRVLEMSDIVLLITDIRHPVSTRGEGDKEDGEEDSCGVKGGGRSWEMERFFLPHSDVCSQEVSPLFISVTVCHSCSG